MAKKIKEYTVVTIKIGAISATSKKKAQKLADAAGAGNVYYIENRILKVGTAENTFWSNVDFDKLQKLKDAN